MDWGGVLILHSKDISRASSHLQFVSLALQESDFGDSLQPGHAQFWALIANKEGMGMLWPEAGDMLHSFTYCPSSGSSGSTVKPPSEAEKKEPLWICKPSLDLEVKKGWMHHRDVETAKPQVGRGAVEVGIWERTDAGRR